MARWLRTKMRTGKHAAVVVVLALLLSLSTAAAPRPAHAIFGIGDLTFTEIVGNIWQGIQDAAKFAWEHGAPIAFRNASHYFANQVAYDTAVWLGSGGNGQQPMFVTQGWGAYLSNVGDAAAGDFLDTFARVSSQGQPGICTTGSQDRIGQMCVQDAECGTDIDDSGNRVSGRCSGAVAGTGFTNLGLCAPAQGLGSFQLAVLGPLLQERRPLAPSCTLSQIEQNWSTILANPETALVGFNAILDPRQNDLGVALSLRQEFRQRSAIAEQVSGLELQAGAGLKAVTDPITHAIKTPLTQVEQQAKLPQELASQEFSSFTGDIAADALNTFTNTLASRLMQRLIQGTVPSPGGTFNPSQFGNIPSGGVSYAVQANSSIATPQLVSGSRIDVISDFSNCPDNQAYAALNNCTIDTKFAQALRAAQAGKALTVQEAIDQGTINGGWVFKRDRPLAVRTPDAWYLSDLRKLRKARFIPVGWELAADKFAGTDITLQQVIGHRDQGYTDGFLSTPSNPYYHLIDPNWVLKAPEEQCRIQGYGQQLEPQGGNRQQSCVDTQNCVAENADGTCQAWGYCTKEKNIWRMGGDSCEFPAGSGYSPFATCQAFTSSTGAQATYLQNSLTGFDDGTCTSDSVGCRWYSTAYNPAPATPVARYDANQRLYLKNTKAISCDPASEGCHQFLRLKNITVPGTACSPDDVACLTSDVVDNKVTPLASTDTYQQYAQVQTVTLKEAPTYLNCYDSNPSNDSPLCPNFLKACTVDQVGCQLYRPTDGSPAIPGIKGSSCPAECVGFNSYDQLASFFEPTPIAPAVAPVVTSATFIPSTAQSCPASAVGCEEFTNVQTEAREYYSELRQCIAPNGTEQTYYTWVGSNLTGYQLKTWVLEPETGLGTPPATTDSSGDCQASFGVDPDCKQYYDTTGGISYRLASKTITASASCTQYRATNVGNQADCQATGGTWNPAATPTPACFYHAIPQEGRLCSAQYLGCREYRGPTASNVRLVFPIATFGDSEAGVAADTSATGGFVPGINSTESVSAFGHSLDSGAGNGTISKDVTGKLTLGKQYTLSFWVKTAVGGNGSISASLNTAPVTSFGSVNITGDWQVYTLGPVVLSAAALPTSLTINSTRQFFLDNVALREIGDTFFVKKNSWQTPATCQAPRDLRCTAYTDPNNTQVTLTDFSKVCPAAAVGCEALVDTRNSSSPHAATATAGDQTVQTPADQVVYRVYDTSKACAATAKACMRIGAPTLDVSSNVQAWTDTFVKLNPDTLDGTNPASPLCSSAQNFCQAFIDPTGTTHFFKDPGSSTCEYKQVDTLPGYDWYMKGTTQLCNLVQNPSFEQVNDSGANLLSNGDLESYDTTAAAFTDWTASSTLWSQSNTEFYQGSHSAADGFIGGTASLTHKSFSVSVGQTYTARVWTKADAQLRRTLRVTGCGVNVSDYTESQDVWEKLQVSFTPTTRSCDLALTTTSSGPNGEAFYDAASVTLADVFPGWQRNGGGVGDPPLVTLTAHESVAGQYWGSNVLELQSTDQLNSGVWSSTIALNAQPKPRTLTLTARVYVPNVPRNSNLLNWSLTYRTTPALASTVQPGFDLVVTPASPKGQWLTKQAVIVLNSNVTALSLGLITNPGSGGTCTAVSCHADQVVYLDQVTVTESSTAPAYLCPANQISCKAFRDPTLTKQTYYYLDNSKLDKSSCSGRVGEKDGCLLFTDLSSSQLSWNSAATYAASQNASVAPVSADPNDSNVILKVARDRVCGEWLSCQSESTKFVNGKTSSVCYALGLCNAWGASGVGKCGNWLTPQPNPQPLNTKTYTDRATDWSGQDYSGYSIPNLYPIEDLTQKNYSTNPATPDVRLTYIDPVTHQDNGLTGSGPYDTSGNVSNTATSSKACRVYPEADSPFPDSIVKDWQPSCDPIAGGTCGTTVQLAKSKETGYKDANTCQQGQNCECFYRRAAYSAGQTLFYGLNADPAPVFAVDGGGSSRLTRNDYLLGLRGYCLERDTSRLINGTGADATAACLTWLPVDTVSGDLSIYDYSPEAGYQSSGGDTFFCSQAAGLYNLGKTASGVGVDGSGYIVQSHLDLIGKSQNDNFGGTGDNFVDWSGSFASRPETLLVDQTIPESAIAKINITHHNGPNEFGGTYCNNDQYWFYGDLTRRDGSAAQIDYGAGPGNLNQYIAYEGRHVGEGNGDGGNGTSNEERIGLLFSKADGQLKWGRVYMDHVCKDTGTAYGEIMYYVKDFCSQAVQASDNLNNKAWTNRVLGATGYAVKPTNQLGFTSARPFAPYGRFTGQPNGFLVVSDRPGGVGLNSSYTTVSTPYSCGPGGCGGGTGMCVDGTKSGVSWVGKLCQSSADCEDSGNPNGVCTGYFSGSCTGNANLSCITTADCQAAKAGTCGSYRTMDNNVASAARSSVQQIFAKEYGSVLQWQGAAWGSGGVGADVSGPPLGKFGGNVPAAPLVTQVVFDSITKAPSQGGNGITLQTSSGEFTSGQVVLSSPAPVTALFYGYNPNGEQMPLTTVSLDWRDGSTPSGSDGKYKNHKHLCEPATVTNKQCSASAAANAGLTCTSDAQCGNTVGACRSVQSPNPRYNFGDSTQACVDDSAGRQGFFSFTRVYTCTSSDPAYQANALGSGQGACVFIPQVMVQDNWGWCTNGRWDATNPPTGECDPGKSTSLGWVKFNGQVLVKP